MYLTALDLGSSQIKALVAETQKDGKLLLRGVFKLSSEGIRRGEIVDLERTTRSINQALTKVRAIHKNALRNIFVNIGGPNVKTQLSKGFVAISRADNEIYSEDIDRVIKSSQAITLNPNRSILHAITREFIVDGIGDISDPMGMIGSRLEVSSFIIEAFAPSMKNVVKCVETAGGRISGLIYNPLAASRSILTKNQKELGVVMIDIGFGTTSMTVYEEDRLISATVFPVGTGHISNDLAIGLRCLVKIADIIKLTFGFALSGEISLKEKVNLRQFDNSLQAVVSRRFICQIIESRLAEIFEFINNELKIHGKTGQLPAGAVICGGGAKIPGIIELARQELKLPVQLGIPDSNLFIAAQELTEEQNFEKLTNSGFEGQVEDPELAVTVGLLLLSNDQLVKESGWFKSKKGFIGKILRHLIP